MGIQCVCSLKVEHLPLKLERNSLCQILKRNVVIMQVSLSTVYDTLIQQYMLTSTIIIIIINNTLQLLNCSLRKMIIVSFCLTATQNQQGKFCAR